MADHPAQQDRRAELTRGPRAALERMLDELEKAAGGETYRDPEGYANKGELVDRILELEAARPPADPIDEGDANADGSYAAAAGGAPDGYVDELEAVEPQELTALALANRLLAVESMDRVDGRFVERLVADLEELDANTREELELARAMADATFEVGEEPGDKLTAALSRAQADFPVVPKNKTAHVQGKDGKAGYSYKYADVSDVLRAVRPVLARHGLAVTQITARPDDHGRTRLVTELRHVAGGILTSETEIAAAPGNPQQFGSSLTYLRRYALTSLLGISAEEDLDASNVEPEGRRSAPAPAPVMPGWSLEASRERKAELLASLESIGLDRAQAKGMLTQAAAAWGHVPDVIVGFANGLRDRLAPAPAPEAEVERARQDAAAEQPHTPTPEPAPDPPAPEPVDAPADPGAAGQRGPSAREQIAAMPEAELLRVIGTHPDATVRAMAQRELNTRIDNEEPPAGAGDLVDEDKPTPGTVELPALPPNPASAMAVLRAAGCICAVPLKQQTEAGNLDESCPIAGHGIPF